MRESGVFMWSVVIKSILLPLIGTTAGSACVFFLREKLNIKIQKALLGLASGVMVAASVWSLIIPAVERSSHFGTLSFVPALTGFGLGILFMLFLDKAVPEPHTPEKSGNSASSMLFLAVTIHNLPEGMAVGAILASFLENDPHVTGASAVALALGIAIQNFPEGSIISMPMAAEGKGKVKSFLWGALSGIVEPLGAIITMLLASSITPILPYVLSFAAGARVFVTVNELIPQMCEGKPFPPGTAMFAIGFGIMMALDVALG